MRPSNEILNFSWDKNTKRIKVKDDTLLTGVGSLEEKVEELVGEAQASPTANTVLARLKSLEDKIDAITDGTTPAAVSASEIETKLTTLLTKDGFDAKADIALTSLRDALRGTSDKTLTDLATALASLATSAKQDTSQTTLASILAKLIAAPATEAKQDTLIAKDFATQTTLAAINTLIGEKQDTPTANTLLARIKSLEGKIDAINDVLDAIVNGTAPAVTQLAEGTELVGEVGIDQTTDGTTNRVVAKISQTAGENLVQLSGSNIRQAVAITPDDDNDLTDVVYSLTCAADGVAYVDFVDGGQNIPINLISGYWSPIVVKRVRATNTTATGIVGQVA